MLRQKKVFYLFITSIFIFYFFTTIINYKKKEKPANLYFGQNNLNIIIADTVEKRRTGLSGRNSLSEKEGMLFVYDKSDFYGIWMKDMFFPIDVIWLDENYKVVDIANKITPDTFPKIFRPRIKSKYVLEVAADWSQEKNLRIGDSFHQ